MENEDVAPLSDTPTSITPNASELWSCLTMDPTSGILLVSRDLRVLYANEVVTKMLFGKQTTTSDIIGRLLSELYPPQAYAERVRMADTVAESGKPMLSRTIWNGQQMVAWIYPLGHEEDQVTSAKVDQFLVVMRPDTSDFKTLSESTPDTNIYQTQYIDLGQARQLTHAELVVLALIGQDMTLREIAKHLHRSIKTVEAHRLCIGRKLEFTNRGELIKFVQQLGLKVTDVNRKDLQRDNKPYYKQSSKDV